MTKTNTLEMMAGNVFNLRDFAVLIILRGDCVVVPSGL